MKFKHFLVILLLFSCELTGCATGKPERIVIKQEGVYLKDLCACYCIDYKWSKDQDTVVLGLPDQEVKMKLESNIVHWEEKEITLDGPIKQKEDKVIVPFDFKEKIIDRFVNIQRGRLGLSLRKADVIVIDAGHGGKDSGAVGKNGLKEKEVVLDIARKLKSILEKKGLKVIMTRDGDEFVSLSERTEIASASKAQLFISIHANASRERSVKGLEVYLAKDLNFKDRNEIQRRHNQNILMDNFEMEESSEAVDIIADMLYSHKQNASRALACTLADNTSTDIKTTNRGHKEERFYVLRNTLIPAVLIEVGFVSNPYEERLLRKKAYRYKIAYSIAESILDYVEAK